MPTDNLETNFYTTTDIYLAATLASLGYTLQEIIQEDTKFQFLFQDSLKLKEDVENYWASTLMCNPRKAFVEFKGIKARMYDLRRRKETNVTT